MTNTANTIATQIGNPAFAMLGATGLAFTDDSLSFKVGKNPKRVSCVKVTLMGDDTYTLRFYNRKYDVTAEVSDVYAT